MGRRRRETPVWHSYVLQKWQRRSLTAEFRIRWAHDSTSVSCASPIRRLQMPHAEPERPTTKQQEQQGGGIGAPSFLHIRIHSILLTQILYFDRTPGTVFRRRLWLVDFPFLGVPSRLLWRSRLARAVQQMSFDGTCQKRLTV